MLNQVPEYGDGGYWYVVEGTPNSLSDDPAISSTEGYHCVGFSAANQWQGEIGGVTYFSVRTPDPVAGIAPKPAYTVADVLAAAGASGKPSGRIGGR